MRNREQAIGVTTSGKVEGFYKDGIYVFKGIPYAAPPTGDLRWMPPKNVKPWEGIRQAKVYGAPAPQIPMPVRPPGADFDIGTPDESCLFLNIWTPGLDDARRPVMLWIHGGAFIVGGGTEPSSHGGVLAKRGDVVVVSLNYRLGALGFINLKEITGGKIPAIGNEGLLDQVAALKWVHNNISAFGGDPDNITAFGFSAGSMSIGCLMGMPAAKGLFHKSLHQSGAANTVGDLGRAVEISTKYLKILGIKPGDFETLRSLPYQKLLDAQEQLQIELREKERVITPFQPIVDGEVIPERPLEAIKKGSAKKIITMAGTTLEEWKGLSVGEPGIMEIEESGLIDRLQRILPSGSIMGIIQSYRLAREKRKDGTRPFEILAAIQTDLMFRMPTIQLIEAQRDNGQLSYNYIFTYESPQDGGIYGACHGLDRRFIFGTLDEVSCGSGPVVDKLSRSMQDAWLAFARTGNPSCKSLGKWPPYGTQRMTMLLDKVSRVEAAPYEDERRIWDKYKFDFSRPI